MKPNTDNGLSRATTALAQQWGVTIKAINHRTIDIANDRAAHRFADRNKGGYLMRQIISSTRNAQHCQSRRITAHRIGHF